MLAGVSLYWRLEKWLRKKETLVNSHVGVTGANFLVAETGSSMLVTNEGNSRFCLAATKCHIALIGIEKIVPRDRDLALLLNLLFTVALMVLIQQTWTLPGLAGLVLTVGMSVDANVLVFERIREELRENKGLPYAIDRGYDRAFLTIFGIAIGVFALVVMGSIAEKLTLLAGQPGLGKSWIMQDVAARITRGAGRSARSATCCAFIAPTGRMRKRCGSKGGALDFARGQG